MGNQGSKEARVTRARCWVCQEKIVETVVVRPVLVTEQFESLVWRTCNEYYCPNCGIMYRFIKEETA